MPERMPSTLRPRDVAEAFLAQYCQLLDEDRLEEWSALFAEAGSYRVLSRENIEQDLPGAILLLETRGGIEDRVMTLRQAAVYNIHSTRHLYSGIVASVRPDGVVEFTASFSVYQTDQDGHTRLFCVGSYQAELASGTAAPVLGLAVRVDTFAIPTLLAVPL